MSRLAWVEIDVRVLAENVRRLRELVAPSVSFMAVVKGDAYGHGALLAARTALAAGADRIGVAFAAEGVELREDGVKAPLHVLGAVLPEQAADLVEYRLTPCLGDEATAKALNQAAARAGERFAVHVKVDTGLHRLGFSPREAIAFARKSRDLSHLLIEGVSTHMARGDDGHIAETERQFHDFLGTVRAIEDLGIPVRLRHVAATPLIIDRPDMHLDMVRAGVGLFGYAPLPGQAARAGIKPVMSLKSRIAQVRTVGSGEGVGYEHRFRTNRVSRIGTVPAGYVDGVLFGLDRGGQALVRGQRVPVCGRGCMDHSLVDLTEVPEAGPGDEIVFIGRQGDQEVWADEWASLGGRPVEDVLAGLARKRVSRVVVGED